MKSGQPRQPTLGRIAHEAGVSITTVSRVLSDKKLGNFSAETIERVRAVAENLKYRPNRLVRGMQTGQTGLVGVLMPAHGGYYGRVMSGVHDVLMEEDRAPIVLWTNHDALYRKGKTELEQIHTLVDLRVEGIILKPIFDAASDEYLREIFDRHIPLVVVDRELPNIRANFVGNDDRSGILMVLEHLFSLGHRRIGYYGPQTDVSTGVERHDAFRRGVEQQPQAQALPLLTDGWVPSIESANRLLEQGPTAVVTVNDDFALHLYRAAEARGFKIPEDLSVTGYGDTAISPFMTPALTTVDQYPYEIGRSAAHRLLSQIRNPSEPMRKELLPVELLVRGSTAPPRTPNAKSTKPRRTASV